MKSTAQMAVEVYFTCPKLGEVVIEGKNLYAVYSDDSSFGLILGMGETIEGAWDNAAETVKRMDGSDNVSPV